MCVLRAGVPLSVDVEDGKGFSGLSVSGFMSVQGNTFLERALRTLGFLHLTFRLVGGAVQASHFEEKLYTALPSHFKSKPKEIIPYLMIYFYMLYSLWR